MLNLTRFVACVMAMAILALSSTGPTSVELNRAYASVDATSTWNSVCHNWGFPQAPVGSGSATFRSVWPSGLGAPGGMTFEDALAGIQAQVSGILAIPDPGFGGDDTFDYSIQNWPDS